MDELSIKDLKASHVDLFNVTMAILLGCINTTLCSWWTLWTVLFLIVHICFSKSTFKNLRENLFD